MHLFKTERPRLNLNKYIKKNEAEKYVFYKIPKALFTDDNTNPFQPMQKCSTD